MDQYSFTLLLKKKPLLFNVLNGLMLIFMILSFLVIFIDTPRFLMLIFVIIAISCGITKDFVKQNTTDGLISFKDNFILISSARKGDFKIMKSEITKIKFIINGYTGQETYANFRDFTGGKSGSGNLLIINMVSNLEYEFELFLENKFKYEEFKKLKSSYLNL